MNKRLNSGSADMLHGSLTKNIMIFAIPLALTGILQQLFNAADVAVVGRYVGKNAMAAVGSNGAIVGLIVNFFVGISLGSNVVLARLTGMQTEDRSPIVRAVDVSILLALVCGFAAAALGEALSAPILRLTSVPEEVFDMALAYLRIYLLGLPVILLYNFEAAILRSQGDSLSPLICLTASGIINVGLNLFFVRSCGMTADGVALATVISNLIASVALFVILTHSHKSIGIHRHRLKIDWVILREIIRIGIPSGLQSAMFSISNICIQSAINALGSDIMAASSAAFNIEIFPYYITNAFGQACTTFTGQNTGARKFGRSRLIMWKCLLLGELFTVSASFAFLLAGKPLLQIFRPDALVVEYGMVRLRYILYGEAVNVVIEILSGAMRGYGWSLEPATLSLVGICGVRIIWVFAILPMHNSFSMLLWCYPISWAITATALVVVYALRIRHLNLTLSDGARPPISRQ